jgi:sugar O-acyltransferase (sialic acid O-acetyltransferase NeuD family)
MKPLIVVGGGGFAREVIWIADCLDSEWRVIGILDSDYRNMESPVCGVEVLGDDGKCADFPDAWYVIAVGSPRARRKIQESLVSRGVSKFATLIHPAAKLSRYVSVGEGSIVTANVIATTQVSVGAYCILNLAVTVGHDSSIGGFCTIAPGTNISGNVQLGESVEVGSGVTIVPGISVARGCFIAAGSVVTKSLSVENEMVAGNPCRRVRMLDPLA